MTRPTGAWGRFRRRLRSETLRAVLASTSILIPLVVFVVGANFGWFVDTWFERVLGDRWVGLMLNLSMFWILYATVYVWLTHLAFHDATVAEFRAALRLARMQQRNPLVRYFVKGDNISEAIQVALTATIAVLLVTQRADVLGPWLTLVAAVLFPAATWVLTAVNFALSYAQLNLTDEQLRIPGTEPARYPDYLSLAFFTQSSAAPAAMEPLTTAARKLTRTHAILAHFMNTVVLALGISVVVSLL